MCQRQLIIQLQHNIQHTNILDTFVQTAVKQFLMATALVRIVILNKKK